MPFTGSRAVIAPSQAPRLLHNPDSGAQCKKTQENKRSIMSNETTPAALSAQDAAIESGKKVLHGPATDRGLRMFEAIRTAGPPRVALERAVYFTESFKATECQPLVLRWAKALKNVAERISVAICDDELIVGR